MKELISRLHSKARDFEWDDIKRDLQALREFQLVTNGESYYLRTELRGTCFDVLNAAGVAIKENSF